MTAPAAMAQLVAAAEKLAPQPKLALVLAIALCAAPRLKKRCRRCDCSRYPADSGFLRCGDSRRSTPCRPQFPLESNVHLQRLWRAISGGQANRTQSTHRWRWRWERMRRWVRWDSRRTMPAKRSGIDQYRRRWLIPAQVPKAAVVGSVVPNALPQVASPPGMLVLIAHRYHQKRPGWMNR